MSLSGGGGFRQGHGGAVWPTQRLPEGGAAEPGQPLRPPFSRRTQEQTQVTCCRSKVEARMCCWKLYVSNVSERSMGDAG